MAFDDAQTGVASSSEDVTYIIPESYSEIPGLSEAARAFQQAIAEDTTEIEGWLSGQAPLRMVVDNDRDNDLLQRAEAEVSAALEMIQQMLDDPELSPAHKSALRDMQSQLTSALGSGNASQILQAAADIRAGQGTFSGLQAARRDFEEALRDRQQRALGAIAEIDEEQRRNADRLRDMGFVTDDTRDALDEYEDALSHANDNEPGTDAWLADQQRIAQAGQRAHGALVRDRDAAVARGDTLPEGANATIDSFGSNSIRRDSNVAEVVETRREAAEMEAVFAAPSQQAGITPATLQEGEEPTAPATQNAVLAALNGIGMG